MSLEEEIGRALADRGLRLAVAESCTGGLLGFRLTAVGGSSAYFRGGCVAYANDVKQRLLGVTAEALDAEGAVSGAVARQMAEGARLVFDADVGIGVTGIAGPGGGTPEKPVGLVFIGLADAAGSRARRFAFGGGRAAVREAAAQAALTWLRDRLKEQGEQDGQ